MTQKIILQLEIDDSQLVQAQAKLDKFLDTLKTIEETACRLANNQQIHIGKLLMNGELFKED